MADTKVKTVTQRWPDGTADGGDQNAFVIPTMG
jgi:malonate-semialdehyde dehydrogenase (acetylating)/methylmalonate-semialdehyde dehydrogenase